MMVWKDAKPDTQLRAANCVYDIEQRAHSNYDEGEAF